MVTILLNGTNIILEYIYNGGGYNNAEWDKLVDYIEYLGDELRNHSFNQRINQYFLDANRIMEFRQMRQNYIFSRISKSGIFDKVETSLTAIINSDDQSYLIYPYVNVILSDRFTLDLSSILFFGDFDSEFGMTHWDQEYSIALNYLF